MKWLVFLFFLQFSVLANSLSIEDFRTDLYSKIGNNTLKKIEITLEFEGDNLDEIKIIDALNTIISSYFYEDLFTEIGKNNFKETLLKFSNKKYKTHIKNIYILKINSIQEFDLEELKRFLKDMDKTDIKEKVVSKKIENTKNILENKEHNISKNEDANISTEIIKQDINSSNIQDVNTSKEAMDIILKTMENTQMQMLAPSKDQDLFKELPY
ncbi:flagellar basal body-associated FliL family protein [Campylobacter peloridis]|uniref:Flagellar protein FliL n=1 Tax=Campylobacter peloridis TaxID=488546 RepID=A0ABX6TR43_9BACT|nr:flagellar basal body-associated FliL family protein [Campylobacter peloridis]AJC84332.1 hypothetical protein CPEL_0477 [Campylobacter peloridis LMG 23910]MBX1885855.1 flagellar basal body-associated FliL family protein [Campylobacter peloridis]QOQ88430.1 flagellar basal body-associated FliL family protein [Campylobacter peloridis]